LSYRTPMGRARGLGAAKEGTAHWWAQRLTSVALVPLAVWFVASVVSLVGADYATVRAWLGEPVPVVMMVLLIIMTFHHGQLGLQVVIEDYVGPEGVKVACIIVAKFAMAVLGLLAIFGVLKLAFAG